MVEENEEMKSAWHHLHSRFISVGGGRFVPDKERVSQAVLEVEGWVGGGSSVCMNVCLHFYMN